MKNKNLTAPLVWLCITIFYCYQSILRPLPNIIMPDIMNKYSIGGDSFGSLGIYYIGYALAHIPVGILLNRFGGKHILPIGVLFTSLGLIPFVYMDSWNAVIIGRVFTGVGSATAALGALQIFRMLFHETFSRMIGIMVSCGLIAVVYTTPILTRIVAEIGMENTSKILLYLGVALSITTYIFMPKSLDGASQSNIWNDIKVVICNYRLFALSIASGLMIGPIEGFSDAWGSAFLMSLYSVPKLSADSTIASISLGMCVGCVVLPYIADKTRMYFGVLIVSGISMAICVTYMVSGKASVESLYYICLTIGLFSAYQIVALSKSVTFVSKERSGLAGSIVNMIAMTFGLFFHKSIGTTLNTIDNGGTTIDGVTQYSEYAYKISISIIPIGIGIALFILLFMAMGNMLSIYKANKNQENNNVSI